MIKTNWTGDDGKTRLAGGEQCNKDSPRVDAYGDVDELNSFIGLAITRIDDNSIKRVLKKVQADLFTIGAELAKAKGEKSRLQKERIEWIEETVKEADSLLPELTKFILPGGSPGAALLHSCRAICRRAERKCVALKKKEIVSEEVVKYLNRLSSLLFSMARLTNKKTGVKDEEWV